MTLSAEDKQGVMELIASYAVCIDSGDIDGYVNNFLPDGILEYSVGTAKGRDEIRTWVSGLKERGIVGGTPATMRHFVGLPRVTDGSDGRARALTYCVIFNYGDAKQIQTPLVATYDDTCVKQDGRWLFEKRTIIADLGVGRG